MPRFFFHLRSPQKYLVDCEGMMLRDLEAARAEATKAVEDFLQPATGRVHAEWQDWRIEVSDQRGRCVFAMAFADAAGSATDVAQQLAERVAPVRRKRAETQPGPRGSRPRPPLGAVSTSGALSA